MSSFFKKIPFVVFVAMPVIRKLDEKEKAVIVSLRNNGMKLKQISGIDYYYLF